MPERKLNKAQKAAVEYTDGPLLIVAGAGTGKTTVITQKICYLLENNLAKPEEILALTFNDKAALEIQERADSLINIGYTELTIATFHSFCQRILERHAIDIGLSNQFELLTESAAWILMRKNLDKFNLDYYRPLGNPSKHIHELLRHFSKCKDELITPAEYLAYAEGLSKDNGTVNLEEKNRITELANAYHAYNQYLIDHSLFDFGDLIFYTHKLFSERKAVLQRYQKQYKYILVDEFQDVNWAQYSLVQMLAEGGAQLTVVGDDDQSIYAFRGASVSNIMNFKTDFPTAKDIVLNENYRSRQAILDVAYASIQHNNPDRLEVKLSIDKKLISPTDVTPKESMNTKVVHLHRTTLEEEVRAVVDEIERLKQIDEKAVWDDFAILVRANNHAEPFTELLEARGIPFEFLASSGLYRQPVVLDCLNFFKVLEDHTDSVAMFRLLRIPFFRVKENDLHKITSTAKRKSYSYYEALKRCRELGLSEEGVAICDKLISLIHDGLRELKHQKPSILLYGFLEKSGYLGYLKTEEEAGNREIIRQNYQLKQFFDYIAHFEKFEADNHLTNFHREFTLTTEAGDRGKQFEFSDTPDSVNILTVHASKGLEFKYVFIVNLVEERFPTRSKGDGIEIPLELIKEQLPEGDSHYQEERRLFYVAATRAKEKLYFSSAANYGGVRPKKLSRFLDEIGYKADSIAAGSSELVAKKPAPDSKRVSLNYELPKSFSFSHIQMYQTCPYRYKLSHVLNLPSKGSHYFSFGTSIHNTLQAFYTRVQEMNSVQQVSLFDTPRKAAATAVETKLKVPPVEELLALYEKKWIGDWYQSRSQREQYYEKGKEVLKTFYKAQEDSWTVPVFLEDAFKIKMGDYLLSGRFDRIDQLPDGSLEIIDYKTGKSKKLTADVKEQLLIYQIAAEQLPKYRHLGKPSKLTFYYLEEGIKTEFIGDNEDLERLRETVVGTIDQIKAGDFTPTPSQFACERCDFRDICEFRV